MNQAGLSPQVILVATCYFGWLRGLAMDSYVAEIFDFGRLLKEAVFQNDASEQYL